eukprot:CAMPEP_0178996808 /NCGR_PEP_ID=MMETSP0795-20121207/8577_1 /TAXON_ID=88552 /ORGANISM="Amoebophrya sp., Strain Ameob2" /LENGTH=73 /DNA_ID=CAMNT_0020689245 /DNA_START=87 /DNA_END=308 /DNA_ORIENTATION=+
MDLDSYVKVREGALRDEYYKYLDSHPELQQILTDFLTALVVHTPDDVYAFAAEYFAAFKDLEAGEETKGASAS